MFVHFSAFAQELFVHSEPASNMPAKSIGARVTAMLMSNGPDLRLSRFQHEIMWGVTKKIMVHGSAFHSSIYTNGQKLEGGSFYLKYRFISSDYQHGHFRCAAFSKLSIISNPLVWQDINPDGDRPTVAGGLVATQLFHKLAISLTSTYFQAYSKDRLSAVWPTKALAFHLAGGYLLWPRRYKNYNQVNINIYSEITAKLHPQIQQYYIDFSPSVQLIIKSRSRIDFSWRRQLDGNMNRYSNSMFFLRYEYTFFNAYR